MSTNYGRTTTSGNNVWVQNTGSNNQYGFLVSSVPAGQISFLDVYMDGNGGTCRTILCLWNSSGTLLAQTAQFTASSGGGGINGQTLHRAALTSVYFTAGGNFYVGFWRNPSDSAEWSYVNSGGTIHPSAPSGGVANVSSPGNLSTGSSTTGQMTAYLEWDSASIYGKRSGPSAPATVQGVYGNASAGAPHVAKVYRGPTGGGTPIRIF